MEGPLARPQGKRNPPSSTTEAHIPDKLYFRIGEVARLLSVEPFVLRFWETEFPQLKPGKGVTGQRLYRRHDVETAVEIRQLLYVEGYTIPGARQLLQSSTRKQEARSRTAIAGPKGATPASLQQLRQELQEIAGILSRPVLARQANARVPRPKARDRRPAAQPQLFTHEG